MERAYNILNGTRADISIDHDDLSNQRNRCRSQLSTHGGAEVAHEPLAAC